jgi:transposase-like protein
MFLQLRDNADVLNLETDMDRDEIRCDQCESLNVIKRGVRKTKSGEKQRYECKECGRRFTDNREKYRKANKELIALTMDLYFKGLSTRKIADTLEQFHKIDVHHTTVSRWINTYMEKINEKTKELEPNVGEVWHVDEQKIRVDGEWHYSWNVMDENRYLIANTVTKERSILETEMVLRKALENAKGVKPRAIITDGMSAYPAAIRNVFGSETVHIGGVGIRDPINNNVLERYHGTYRERDKVMRGLYKPNTARKMTENIRTYYNFIRPHSGIEGFTPAQQAGITTDVSRNRWMGLLNQSL